MTCGALIPLALFGALVIAILAIIGAETVIYP